jgi:hypothetical protein
MDVERAFELGPQCTHAGKPDMHALHNQAVSAQSIVAFHVLASDAGGGWAHRFR